MSLLKSSLVTQDTTLTLRINSELKQQLIALSFVYGFEGEYSKITRALLSEVAEQQIKKLDEDKKKEFDTTMDNLRLQEQIKQNKILGVPENEEKENGETE